MSIPDQSKMKQECSNQKSCMEMLQSIVDGEATPEEREHFLTHHLEQCLPCYKNYHLEVEIRQLLKSKCTGQAPQELIDTIRARVSQNLVP